MTRIEQKDQTRRRLIDVALSLSAEKSFSALSLREVAAGAGITAAGFYRHFKSMDELGLALMDEVGLSLRKLMRETRQQRPRMSQSDAIALSVKTYLGYIQSNKNLFRLLVGERMGASPSFRKALRAELDLFINELADDLTRIQKENKRPLRDSHLAAEGIVAVLFLVGAEAIDAPKSQVAALSERLNKLIHIIFQGSV